MSARELREFRIDDSIDDEVAGQALRAGHPLINGFLAAQEVFRTFGLQAIPELVLIDVNFDQDQSDPLAAYGKRPTGLLYGLSLLTWARVMRRPVGIAFHTADPGLWVQCESPAMRDLVILLVGLNAALSDSATKHRLFRAGEIDEAVNWLRGHAAGNEAKARLRAAEDFRRCLQDMADPTNVAMSGLFVDPWHHAKVLTECEKLATATEATGRGISRRGQSIIVYINGERNEYAVEGLFPAVAGGLRADDLRLSSLNAAHTVSESAKREVWEFDPDVHERPLVGDYLQALGTWQDVFERATATLPDLGCGDQSPRLPITQLIRSSEAQSDVKQLTTILFQIVCQHRLAWGEWTARWAEAGWQPWNESRDIGDVSSPSHRDWLRRLHRAIQELGEDANEVNLPDRLNQLGWESVWGTSRIDPHDILKPAEIGARLMSPTTVPDAMAANLIEEVRSRLSTIDSSWRAKLGGAIESAGGAHELLAHWLTKVLGRGALRGQARKTASSSTVMAENRFLLESLFGASLAPSSALPNWLENDLRVLKAYKVVTESRDECGRKWITSEWPESLNGIPRPPGATFVPAWLSTSGLLKSLGFTEYKQIARVESRVGIDEGTVQKIMEGGSNCPGWLKGLCIRFAQEIGWLDDTGWPVFMRSA